MSRNRIFFTFSKLVVAVVAVFLATTGAFQFKIRTSRIALGGRIIAKPVAAMEYSDADEEYSEFRSIKEEITDIIRALASVKGGINAIDPSILTESAHVLAKGRYYEVAMEEIIRDCSTAEEVAKVEALDAFLRGFIISERKQRSRLKLNYILAGAASNRLEESIAMLVER